MDNGGPIVADETPTENEPETETPVEDSEEFRPITTQDDLNRVIGERIQRERSKFADYYDFKAKAERFDEIEEANKTEQQRIAERAESAERERDEARTEALRLRVAAKHAISDEDADLFLTGTDEESLTKQAERLAARESSQPRAPRPNAAQDGSDVRPQGDWLRQQLARN